MSGNHPSQPAKLLGCSVIGPLHVQTGLPNQDAWLARRYTWGEVIAVADGLGSKRHSDIGSKAACRAVAYAARRCRKDTVLSPEQFTRELHTYWLNQLGDYPVNEYATTCLFAVRHHDTLTLGRLGDGMIAAIGRSAQHDLLLSDNKTGGFANTTDCLHSTKQPQAWEIVQLKASGYARVLLCTDGISDDIQDGLHLAFAKSLMEAYAELPYREAYRGIRQCLMHWTRPGHTDDKTLAILNLTHPSH